MDYMGMETDLQNSLCLQTKLASVVNRLSRVSGYGATFRFQISGLWFLAVFVF